MHSFLKTNCDLNWLEMRQLADPNIRKLSKFQRFINKMGQFFKDHLSTEYDSDTITFKSIEKSIDGIDEETKLNLPIVDFLMLLSCLDIRFFLVNRKPYRFKICRFLVNV